MAAPLTFDVHVSPSLPEVGTPPVPQGFPSVTSPLSSVLIVGEREALLVDTAWSVSQVATVGDWVASFEQTLTGIYITHGHGDHWFGARALCDRFPGATVYATAGTAASMERHNEDRSERWDARFPGQVSPGFVLPEIVSGEGFALDGHAVQPIELGHTDTAKTTALWVPDLELLAAGDAVYNHCHLYLNESGDGGMQAWHHALDLIETLEPAYVVAGHKDRTCADDPGAIERTREYLDTFAAVIVPGRRTRIELFDEMLRRYPDDINPKALWRSITALTAPDRP